MGNSLVWLLLLCCMSRYYFECCNILLTCLEHRSDWFGLKSFSANVGTLYVIPTFSSKDTLILSSYHYGGRLIIVLYNM